MYQEWMKKYDEIINGEDNMTDEEKKAIEMLDKFITEHKLYNIKQSDGLEDNIKIVLNLIEKQEKELKKLKKQAEMTAKAHIELTENLDATIEKQEKVIDEIKYKLEEQIQFCNREKNSSENNHICYLSVGFYEKLLDIINKGEKDEPR